MNFEAPLFAVVGTPDPVPEHVDRDQWPVHVTIASNFFADNSAEAAIIALLESSARDVPAFEVELGPPALFGANADLPVLLAPHQSFDRLHGALAARLMRLPGFIAVEPNYWLEGYRPHATLGRAVRVSEGQTLHILALTLVSLYRGTGTRIAAFELA